MRIWLEGNITAHPFIDPEVWERYFGLVKEQMPQATIFEYYEKDTLKGFIGVVEGGYIAGLFVGKNSRSQGVGRKLLDYVKGRYPALELSVFVKNEDAVRFYLKNDFQITEEKMNPDFQQVEYHMIWKNDSR